MTVSPLRYSAVYGNSASTRARMIAGRSLRWCWRTSPKCGAAAPWPLRDERLQQLHVLVVDVVDLVRAELADLAAAEQARRWPWALSPPRAAPLPRPPPSGFLLHGA